MFLDIVYLILWAGLGAYCVYSARRLGAILYIAAGFFAFMFGWRLMHVILPIDHYAGVYNIIFRCIAFTFLAVILIIYILYKKTSK